MMRKTLNTGYDTHAFSDFEKCTVEKLKYEINMLEIKEVCIFPYKVINNQVGNMTSTSSCRTRTISFVKKQKLNIFENLKHMGCCKIKRFLKNVKINLLLQYRTIF